ncbi:DUF89 domain-containing protein [uncultured Helicobacter sp.]|uniref:damage-control phosphatase ARMT1 family protein n=3 Tax=uncultured Helicobacter sp. TaxID=175537 RepID=UPI0025E6CA5A|nr:ARMT1-like domain-containing protein [uncultured Helicobacter sp.]
MIAQNACFTCLQRQVKHLCQLLHIPDKHITQNIQHILESAKNKGLLPPQIAIDVYKTLARATGLSDPFYHIKQESMTKAHHIVQNLLHKYPPPPLLFATNSPDSKQIKEDSVYKRLEWAVKMAILGNVIDYGSQHSFDFDNANFGFESIHFATFCLPAFIDKLSAKTLLYIADNAGENIFDKVLIATLKEIYPHIEIYYALRGKPIINDLTLEDMSHPLAKDMQEYCTLLDSGVRSPGFVYTDALPQAQAIYDRADVILAKGMGNFECLNMHKDERLFLLFKVKCDVVAAYCGVQKGAMMFIHNTKVQKE